MGKAANWLKLPGPFGFPRYGWIAGLGAMLVAGYIFYRNRKQSAQSPTVNPNATLAGGSMMPTTMPYPGGDGSGFPSYPPIPATNYPSPPPVQTSASSTQIPNTDPGGYTQGSGNLITTPTQNQTGQKPTVLSNSAILPIQMAQAQATGKMAPIGGKNTSTIPRYNYSPPPGALAPPPTRTPLPVSSPTSRPTRTGPLSF
jgi:hypothetical protein